MQDLSALSVKELKVFFNSFDFVLSDVDGVLWDMVKPYPGAQDAIKSLKTIGKKVVLVSNNTTKSLASFYQQVKNAKFDIEQDEIITPILTTLAYLKKQNLQNKEIFLIGMTPLRQALEEAGFKVYKNYIEGVPETIPEFLATSRVENLDSVGAVVFDVDFKINYLLLQRAAFLLKNPEVLFVKGPTDGHLQIGDQILIGPGFFTNILEDVSGRKAEAMAKPGLNLSSYVLERFNIQDPGRVLFIDMGFAAAAGFKKFLVLSGLTTREMLENWPFPAEFKPDYYASSLKTIHDCIQKLE